MIQRLFTLLICTLLALQPALLWAAPPGEGSTRPQVHVKGKSEPSVCPNCHDTVSAEEIGAGVVLCEDHGVLLHKACVVEIGACPSCVSLDRKSISPFGQSMLDSILEEHRLPVVEQIAENIYQMRERLLQLRDPALSDSEREKLLREIGSIQKKYFEEVSFREPEGFFGETYSRGDYVWGSVLSLFSIFPFFLSTVHSSHSQSMNDFNQAGFFMLGLGIAGFGLAFNLDTYLLSRKRNKTHPRLKLENEILEMLRTKHHYSMKRKDLRTLLEKAEKLNEIPLSPSLHTCLKNHAERELEK